MGKPVFYTIGHSNLEIADFINDLHHASITLVVDVRRLPGSKTYPHFNQEALQQSLLQAGIQYIHCPGLAGRRSKQAVDDNLNGAWKNRSFHNYADYALSERFQEAMDRLISLAAKDTVAIMCAESVWWRCHRRIIADHLMAVGHCVKHIIGERITTAELTKFAEVDAQKQVTYPPQDGSLK